MDKFAGGLWEVGMMVLFIGLVALALSASRKSSDAAARMPIDDDDDIHVSNTPGDTAGH